MIPLDRTLYANFYPDSIDVPQTSAVDLAFPTVLAEVCRDLRRLFEMPGAALFLYDDLADMFSVVAVEGAVHGSLLGTTLRTEGCIGDCLEMNALSVVDAASFGGGNEAVAEAFDARALLLVPIWGDGPVAVLALSYPSMELQPGMRALAERLGGEAARRIQEARPDSGHYCLFRRIVHLAPGGFAVVEGDRHVVSYAAASFRRMLSLESVPFLGRPLAEVLRDQHVEIALLDEVYRTGQPQQLPSARIVDQFGPRYYDVHVIPERGLQGTVSAVFIILWPRTDVVETRRALEGTIARLADSQNTLAAVLDSTINGILFADCDDTILYANRRLGELLGIEPRKAIDRPRSEYLRETVGPHIARPETLLAIHPEQSVEGSRVEIEVLRPVRRILEYYSGPVHNDDGSVLGRIDVFSDITEIRELQRNKDEFLSVVSHELKTPVTSIKGYAQLLQRRAARENVSPQMAAAFEIIERQTARMQDLIDMLLDLSRIEVGRLTLSLTRVDLRALLLDLVELTRITVDDRHDLQLDVPDTPIWALADSRRLEQVVTNLLSNAVRFSPDGGTVSVRLRATDTGARIDVRDRGVGIPADAQDRIFERFFRTGTIAEDTGMGIGLFITKSIVEEHGGSIRVESEVGKGSTFTVLLPVDHP